MANEAALIASLQVWLDKFEAGMRKAGIIADGAVRDIEAKFAKANPGAGISAALVSGLGKGLGGLFSVAAVQQLIAKYRELNKEIAEVGNTAQKTGVSSQEIQGLSVAAAAKGVGQADFVKAFDAFADRLKEAKEGETDLGRLFAANNVKLEERNGKLIGANAALYQAANLVQKAASESDQIKIVEALGFTKDWIPLLERGGEVLRSMKDHAIDTGAVINDNLVLKAQDFEKAWTKVGDTIGPYLKRVFFEVGTDAANLVDRILSMAGQVDAKRRSIGQLEGGLQLAKDVGAKDIGRYFAQPAVDADNKVLRDNAMDTLRKGMGNQALIKAAQDQADRDALRIRDNKQFLAESTKVPPPVVKAKAGRDGPDPERFFEREERMAGERAAQLQLEAQMLGKTTEERTKALEALRLEQTLTRGGIEVSDEYRQRIDAVAASLAKSTAAYEQARQNQRAFVELQSFAGNALVDVLDRAVAGGAKLADIMQDVARSIARAALQAAIMGNGPLAGLFGTAGTSGATGGLIGALTNAFRGGGANPFAAGAGGYGGQGPFITGIPGNASGTDSWRGGLSWVGERGPEIVNLPRGAQVIPNTVLVLLSHECGGDSDGDEIL